MKKSGSDSASALGRSGRPQEAPSPECGPFEFARDLFGEPVALLDVPGTVLGVNHVTVELVSGERFTAAGSSIAEAWSNLSAMAKRFRELKALPDGPTAQDETASVWQIARGVSCRPGILEGEACVGGMRVPVRSVASFRDAGYDIDAIKREYPDLLRQDIIDALKWWDSDPASVSVAGSPGDSDAVCKPDPAALRSEETSALLAEAEAYLSSDYPIHTRAHNILKRLSQALREARG